MNSFHRRVFVLLFLSSIVGQSATAADQISVTPLDGKLAIKINGEIFTEYRYVGYDKPILYPIVGPHEIGMTRNYPMKEVPGEAKDHVHHKSMWFTHGQVNGVDFWAEGPECGKIVHDRLVKTCSGEGEAEIQTTNRWESPEGEVVCTDTRKITFSVLPGARVIDWEITIHASEGDLLFGDTKEGMMGLRTHPNLRLQNDPKHGVTTAVGQARNSEGDTGNDAWGKEAKWLAYWGEIEGHMVGVAIFDHPSNPRHPTRWHARYYGLVTANPFGLHDFAGEPKGAGDMLIPAGESITFRYRFLFHEGDVDQAKISEKYEAYAE